MTEWHFEKRRAGWSWRCTTDHGAVESIRNFCDIRDAVADAELHGYVSGVSRIGSLGPVADTRSHSRPARRPAASPRAALLFRCKLNRRWIWELRSRDRHLLIRSPAEFETREECEAHARASGQTVDPPAVT